MSTPPTVLIAGGAPRSGTGLLRRVLGSHPEVALPPVELALHRRLAAGQPVAVAARDLVGRLGGIDAAELDVSSYGTLFSSLAAALARASGRPIAGDKTPGIECHLDLYRRWVPRHRLVLVQMLRHPSDAVASHLFAPWHVEGDSDEAVRRIASAWTDSARVARLGADHADLHVVVRYEQLTATPRAVAHGLVTAMGLDATADAVDAMVEGRSYPRHVNSSFSTTGEVVAGTVHRGVRRNAHLDRAQRAIVADECGAEAELLGYVVSA